eukprot:TRINITY_DN5943_c0_g1_i1.p1 TRINITY_DN5943_c0_g1~~TRINITY_DN5943_c0_g1_i1.p1  ORF type:complete len:525 (+),score=155.21 TRINITY_DN5943_c0_g1_i1:38-1576(+)
MAAFVSWLRGNSFRSCEASEEEEEEEAKEPIPRSLSELPAAPAAPEASDGDLPGLASDEARAAVTLETLGDAAASGAEVFEQLGPEAQALAVAHTMYHETCQETCQALVPVSAPETASTSCSYFLAADLDLGIDGGKPRGESAGSSPTELALNEAAAPGLPSVAELLTLTDFHQVLGVGTSASIEEIKHSYRQRARVYHPDKHRGVHPDVDAAFSQAFVLITRAYMTLIVGDDSHKEKLQLLNKVDLRQGRPARGWALQQQWEERRRAKLTKAEDALREADLEVARAREAPSCHAQQRRLARATLAQTKAAARLQAEKELYEIQRRADLEKAMKQKQREEERAAQRAKAEAARAQKAMKRQKPREFDPVSAAEEEAARLEAEAEEMKKRAALLRAQAQQGLQPDSTAVVSPLRAKAKAKGKAKASESPRAGPASRTRAAVAAMQAAGQAAERSEAASSSQAKPAEVSRPACASSAAAAAEAPSPAENHDLPHEDRQMASEHAKTASKRLRIA